jgi:chemotaxis protein MotB
MKPGRSSGNNSRAHDAQPAHTMDENQNPFADRTAASKRADTRRHLWIAAGGAAAIVVAFFVWVAFRLQAQHLDRVRGELEEVRAVAARSRAEAADLRDKLAGSEARIADLEKEKEMAGHMHEGLEEEMRAALESKDVTISQLQGKLTVNILDRILFDSGEAVVKPAGEAVLQKIAGILAQHPALKIHVIGHTDNVPIRASARSRFASNWELSTARALAAVRFLTETAGVDPRRVGAVGYGEFRPLADNASPEGRAQNRRIAITILADELVGADTAPMPKTTSPANPPPVAPEPDHSAPDVK